MVLEVISLLCNANYHGIKCSSPTRVFTSTLFEGGRPCREGISPNTPVSKNVRPEKIEEGYEKRGVSENEAERRAWATVNKMTGGGKKKGGSGSGKPTAIRPRLKKEEK